MGSLVRELASITLDSATPVNIGDGTVRTQYIRVTADGGDPSEVWLRFDGTDAKTMKVALPFEGLIRAGTIEKHTNDPRVAGLTINESDLGTHAQGATPAVAVTTSGGVGSKRRIMNEDDYYPIAVTIDPYTGELRGEVV